MDFSSNHYLFKISFYRKNVSDKSIIDLMKKLICFRPTTFRPNRKGIKRLNKDTYFEYLEECLKEHNRGHYSVETMSSKTKFCSVSVWTYPSTDIAEVAYSITSQDQNLIPQTEKIVNDFIKNHIIISASIRRWTEREFNDSTDIDTATELHPELTEIKTVGYKPCLNPDPEQFAAHTHDYHGIWFGCCYEMWFGRDYDKYIPTEKLKTFKECKLNETLYNDTIHIILYDSPDEFSTEKSVDRAWAFRKHTDCDRAAEVWEKRVNELAHEAGHFTYEIEEGKFPHGGIRLLKTYLDANGNHVNKCNAVKVHIYECGTNGKPVFEEIVELKQ